MTAKKFMLQLLVSPGYRGVNFLEMERIVGDRGKVIPIVDSIGYMYFAINTDDPDTLREYLKSQGVHSDGSYRSGYW